MKTQQQPTAAAMRAAKQLCPGDAEVQAAMAEIIDRETGLPEAIEALRYFRREYEKQDPYWPLTTIATELMRALARLEGK